jgi:hypothetical protein
MMTSVKGTITATGFERLGVLIESRPFHGIANGQLEILARCSFAFAT